MASFYEKLKLVAIHFSGHTQDWSDFIMQWNFVSFSLTVTEIKDWVWGVFKFLKYL